ncbi:MAG: TolC family protein [Phycisphaeraceae bacterium]|nr:TolC family protein [Phycisphaeraceae bacterium]
MNPFTSHPTDYGGIVSPNRLRTAEVLDLGTFRQPTPPHDPAGHLHLPTLLTPDDPLPISIADCRAWALARNLDLQVALVEPSIANTSLSAQEAAFEAVFFANARYVDTDTPTASTLNAAQQEFLTLEPGVRIPLRTGGTAQISLPVNRIETNNTFSTLNPSYETDLELTLSQPLLRNAGRFAATHGIRIASYNRQISEARTTLAIINELARIDRSYWALYRAREELSVRQKQYELARAQLERAERQFAAGRVAEIEVLRAQAGLADRLDAILQSEQIVLREQRELKRRINAPGLDVDSPTPLLPTSPPDPVRYSLRAAELVDIAVAQRMDLLEIELQLLADAANVRLRQSELLPLLNADLTYRVNGLGGDFGDAFRQLSDNDYTDWSIGLRAEVPLGNRAAEARLRQSILTRLQRLSTKQAREQTIRQEVFDAVDRLEAGWQRILAARQSVVLNRRAFEAETRQFNAGTATSTDVLNAATRLADAESAEIRSIVEYQLAQIDLALATGSLLGAARVRWEPRTPQPD